MELVTVVTIGVLFGSGVYLLLQKSMLRVVFGTSLISHSINLLLLTSGKLKRGSAPILSWGQTDFSGVTDPLPQALILTAIVITFATTALALVLAYRTYQTHGTDNLEELRGIENEQ